MISLGCNCPIDLVLMNAHAVGVHLQSVIGPKRKFNGARRCGPQLARNKLRINALRKTNWLSFLDPGRVPPFKRAIPLNPKGCIEVERHSLFWAKHRLVASVGVTDRKWPHDVPVT